MSHWDSYVNEGMLVRIWASENNWLELLEHDWNYQRENRMDKGRYKCTITISFRKKTHVTAERAF